MFIYQYLSWLIYVQLLSSHLNLTLQLCSGGEGIFKHRLERTINSCEIGHCEYSACIEVINFSKHIETMEPG
jgi:hypothetical protein